MAKGKTTIGYYIAATGCTITNNTIANVTTGILVDDNKNRDWTGEFDTQRHPSRVMQDVQPADNKINDNTFTQAKHNVVYQ